MNEHLALIALAVSLLGTLVVSTWRFSSLASKLLAAVQNLERKDQELETKIKAIDGVPRLEQRVEFIERHVSLIPRLDSRIAVLETRAEFSKEMRQMRASRPDTDEEP